MINSDSGFNGDLETLFDLECLSQSEVVDLTQNPRISKPESKISKIADSHNGTEEIQELFEFLASDCVQNERSTNTAFRLDFKPDSKKFKKGENYIRVEDFDFDGISSLPVRQEGARLQNLENTLGRTNSSACFQVFNYEKQLEPIEAAEFVIPTDKNKRIDRQLPFSTSNKAVTDKRKWQPKSQAERVAELMANSRQARSKPIKSQFFNHQSKSLFEFFPKKESHSNNFSPNFPSIKIKDQNQRPSGLANPHILTPNISNSSKDNRASKQPDEQEIPIEITNAPPLIPPVNFGKVPNPFFNYSFPKNYWYYISSSNFRSYQFQITQTALLYNTLVCLPTGLGKTHIASNVIYNYYKWFPTGKIFFLAPTKPLATQQLDSLSMIHDVNMNEVVNLDGTCDQKQRCQFYNQNRVFFMTPQTLEVDLQRNRLDARNIVLIVFGILKRRGAQVNWKVLLLQHYADDG